MAHLHSIYDTDLHFIIDPISRRISSESGKVTLMQKDHNSERFTFEVPRYIEGHDMSQTDVVQVHYNNLEAASPKRQNKDTYPVVDLQVSPDSDDVVIFSWLISGNATQYVGSLNFIVRFVCYDGEEIVYQWWSDTYTQIKIAATMDNTDESVDLDDTDILESWRQQCIQAVFESEVFSTLKAQGQNYVDQAKSYAEQARDISGLDSVEPLLNNIQTMASVQSVSGPGWFRIAEYESTAESNANGAAANVCDIMIKRGFSNTISEYHLLRLRITHNNVEIISLDDKSGVQLITKARHVVDTTTYKSYVEIYYKSEASNGVHVTVMMGKDRLRLWKAMAPTFTEETVDGVIVTTTYDLPANASPVTNLDLEAMLRQYMPITSETLVLKTSILETALSLPVGAYEYALGGAGYTGGDLPDSTYTYGTATINKRSSNSIVIKMWGHVAGDTIHPPIFNYYNGTKWSGWQNIADGGNAKQLGGLPASAYVQGVSPFFASGETILTWACNPNGIYKKFAVGDYGIPSDAPKNMEGFATVDIDQSTARRIVKYYAFASTGYQWTFTRSIYAGAWYSEWENTADGGNALKLNGLKAEEFPRYLGKVTDIAFINNTSTNYPYICEVDIALAEQLGLSKTHWVIEYYPYHVFNGHGVQKAIPLDPYTKDENPMWRNSAGENWFPWSYYDGGNADTVDGLHAYEFQPYEPGSGYPFPDIKARLDWETDHMRWRVRSVQNVLYPVRVDDADTVDGWHGNQLMRFIGTVDVEVINNLTITEPYTAHISPSVANAIGLPNDYHRILFIPDNAIGYGTQIAFTAFTQTEQSAPVFRDGVSGSWSGWKHFGYGAYLPLDGSVPMSGSLGLNVNGGGFRISPTNIQTQLVANGSATQGFRVLSIITHDYTANDADALRFEGYDGTTTASYTVLHTGNSAKVAIQESAPTDTSALWVY